MTLPPSPLGSVTQPFRSFSRRPRRCRNDVSFSSLCPQEAITAPEAAFPPSPVAPPPASLVLSVLSGHKVGGAGSSAIRLLGEGPSPPTSSPSPRRGDLDSAPLFCTSPSRPATEYRSSAPPWSRHLGPPRPRDGLSFDLAASAPRPGSVWPRSADRSDSAPPPRHPPVFRGRARRPFPLYKPFPASLSEGWRLWPWPPRLLPLLCLRWSAMAPSLRASSGASRMAPWPVSGTPSPPSGTAGGRGFTWGGPSSRCACGRRAPPPTISA